MHHRRHSQLPRPHHDLQHCPVAQLQWHIGHIKLDTTDPLPRHHHRQLLCQNLLCRIAQDEMEAVVDVALAPAPTMILFQHREERLVTALLRRER